MENLKKLVVTEVAEVLTVHSPKGRTGTIIDRHSYGMSFCEEGQITYTHNGRQFVSDKKHVIILPKGQSYTFKGDKTGSFPVINFDCMEKLSDTFMLFQIENAEVFMNDFKMIKKLSLFPENHAKVMSIFYNMIHNLVSEENTCKTIEPAIIYIKKNYNDYSLSNDVLSKECNISEVYLRKLFVKHLKITPKQYISDIRLQKAKQLLSEGVLKIASISEQCGFQSQYNFSRFFISKTGITPTEYMKYNKISKI